MERLIVDRIEGDFAVCETEVETFVTIALAVLPSEVAEGDCLIKDGDTYTIDADETERLRQENFDLMEEIFGK